MTNKFEDYIKLGAGASEGRWFAEGDAIYDEHEELFVVHDSDNAAFIAASRELGPAMAKALIEAEEHIERLIKACDDHGVSETYTTEAERFLTTIQRVKGGE